ncbi:hypothetical protein [Nocardiopsis sp. FR26]|uniref:hypothetical protein n=1 Tax=Nocardiopsis sp. FR26 TaxID=2605987 RepID=UPI001358B866|nr:hypothetical protein [Nocardiopsis sp. FR26]
MSRVTFTSPSGEAVLRGAERARASHIVRSLTAGLLECRWSYDVQHWQSLLVPGHYLHYEDPDTWRIAFPIAFGQDNALLQYRGRTLSTLDLALNTAMAVGSDPVKFLARLHAQCELYGWVDGPHRAWLADIIDRGRAEGLYRDGMGWEDVSALLRARDDEPVVMYDSVGEGFPHHMVGDWMPPWPDGVPRDWEALTPDQQTERGQRQDAWTELDRDEQWRISMAGLRERTGMLELHPDTWENYRFGQRLTILDMQAPNWPERVEQALGLTARPETTT